MGLFSSKKQTIPATGFYAQPKAYQALYTDILSNIGDVLLPDGQVNADMFTPLAQTADEDRAIEMIRQGLTPTPETLGKDISMLMNPFDQYVVDDLNRQAAGDYSLVKQQQAQSGQMGSNRDFLGASDVEQNRLNALGQFKQAQYNQALNQSLGALSGLRQQDIDNLMGVGTFQRGLDYQTNTAPYAALQAAQGSFNAVPTEFGNFGTQQRTVKSGGGLGGFLGAVAPIVGTALGGPVGGMIGGAVGGAMGGGGLSGALQGGVGSAVMGGLSGGFGGGSFGSFPGIGAGGISNSGLLGGLSQGNSLGQSLGSLVSTSSMGPYQPVSFFG